jgi:hypothetical protein
VVTSPSTITSNGVPMLEASVLFGVIKRALTEKPVVHHSELVAGLQEPGCVGVPEFVRRDLLYGKLAA